jgi:hypothetical protein
MEGTVGTDLDKTVFEQKRGHDTGKTNQEAWHWPLFGSSSVGRVPPCAGLITLTARVVFRLRREPKSRQRRDSSPCWGASLKGRDFPGLSALTVVPRGVSTAIFPLKLLGF